MSFYRSCGLIQEQGSEEAAAAWDVAVGATLACDGAPPTLGDMALADGAAATESPCCSLRCSDTWYPIRGYQTNSLTTPRAGPERHVPVPNAAHQDRMSRTWPGARCTRAASARGTVQRPVRMDGFDCRLCGHIGPHFIKSGLGADNLILGNRPWKKYEIGGGHAPRRRGYFARLTYPISEPPSVFRVSASPRAPC